MKRKGKGREEGNKILNTTRTSQEIKMKIKTRTHVGEKKKDNIGNSLTELTRKKKKLFLFSPFFLSFLARPKRFFLYCSIKI